MESWWRNASKWLINRALKVLENVWKTLLLVLAGKYMYTSCAQVHELPQSPYGDNREGTFFSWLHIYIYIYVCIYKFIIYIYLFLRDFFELLCWGQPPKSPKNFQTLKTSCLTSFLIQSQIFPANCRQASLIHNISKGSEQNSLTLCMQIDIETKEKFDTFFFHRCVHRCVHRCAQANQNLCKIYVMAPRLSGGFEGFGNDPV